MAEQIVECEKCKSRNYTILSTEPTNSIVMVNANAKCNVCEHEFHFYTWSEEGKKRRNRGTIW